MNHSNREAVSGSSFLSGCMSDQDSLMEVTGQRDDHQQGGRGPRPHSTIKAGGSVLLFCATIAVSISGRNRGSTFIYLILFNLALPIFHTER